MSSSYDDIAGMYDSLWADWYLPAAMPALEKLVFSQHQEGARVLDVCCGSGHTTTELLRRGYHVTGVDASAALIELAREKLPGVDLRVQDARSLELEDTFDLALSTFDSLNHVLSIEELKQVFEAVLNVLKPNGSFVFDVNLEDAYLCDLREWTATVKDDSVGLVRGSYDERRRMASTELIWFIRRTASGLWERRRSVVKQRCYNQGELTVALAEAGFSRIEALTATQAGMRPDLGVGRMFFSASRG